MAEKSCMYQQELAKEIIGWVNTFHSSNNGTLASCRVQTDGQMRQEAVVVDIFRDAHLSGRIRDRKHL